jgi:hypothetical protein
MFQFRSIHFIKLPAIEDDPPHRLAIMRWLGAAYAVIEVCFYAAVIYLAKPARVALVIIAGAAIIYLWLTAPSHPKCFQLGSVTMGGECRR